MIDARPLDGESIVPESAHVITADDLHAIARALGLVEIPDHLMPRVLKHVRDHRAAMARFESSGIAVADVVNAQVFRA
jgi:hypothetical protein